MFRGAFWIGLAWLCLSQAPGSAAGPAKTMTASCGSDACADPVPAALAAWRGRALAQLQALKMQLAETNDFPSRGVSGADKGEAVLGNEDRLARTGGGYHEQERPFD
jgi:hypothetical protein